MGCLWVQQYCVINCNADLKNDESCPHDATLANPRDYCTTLKAINKISKSSDETLFQLKPSACSGRYSHGTKTFVKEKNFTTCFRGRRILLYNGTRKINKLIFLIFGAHASPDDKDSVPLPFLRYRSFRGGRPFFEWFACSTTRREAYSA